MLSPPGVAVDAISFGSAGNEIVPVTAMDEGGTAAQVDPVVARARVHDRVLFAVGVGVRDGVVAGAAVQAVIARAAEKGVVPVPAGEEVVAGKPMQGVVAAQAVDRVAVRRAGQRIVPGRPQDPGHVPQPHSARSATFGVLRSSFTGDPADTWPSGIAI